MQTVTWTCDCGCGEKATGEYEQGGWLILSQKKRENRRVVRIPKDLHFVDFNHLAEWATKAKEVAESLRKTFTEEPGPHGTISQEGSVLII